LLEPLERADDGLLDGQRGFPAGGADFFGVEKNERVVADPALLAAGVFQFGFEAERAANETDGIIDLNVFVRAEVVGFDSMPGQFGRGPLHDAQHRVEAIADVEVGFLLFAIAEDFQLAGWASNCL